MELKEPLSGGEGDEGVTKAKAKGAMAMAMAMEMEMATMLQSSLRTRTVSTEYVYSVEYFLGNSPHQTRDLYKLYLKIEFQKRKISKLHFESTIRHVNVSWKHVSGPISKNGII